MVKFSIVFLPLVILTIGIANAETPSYFTNEADHNCYYALTPDFIFYEICYPSLDDRLNGESSYSSLSIPELEFSDVIIDGGNTQI